jgi:hypothetical protein
LEKTVGLGINVKSFEDLPLLDVKTDISEQKKNARFDIAFPDAFANRTICLMIGDDISYFTTDANAIITIKDRAVIKAIQKKGFVVVDMEKL